MECLIAIIDEINFDFLNTASEKSDIQYTKGARMSAGGKSDVVQVCFPIFCESIENGVNLLREYSKIMDGNKNKKRGKDWFLHEIRLRILGL